MTTSEVAHLFRVDESTIRRWATNGTLRAIGPGRDLRFRREEVEALLEGREPTSDQTASSR